MDNARTAAAFERHRSHLTGVAYRVLGTMADAEDAVQETYVRFARADVAGLRDVRGWLTTTVARICLDELGSARARREHYVGPWLPEPVVGAGVLAPASLPPEDRVTLDESVSMAMLVLLESLSPAEPTAFRAARGARPALRPGRGSMKVAFLSRPAVVTRRGGPASGRGARPSEPGSGPAASG